MTAVYWVLGILAGLFFLSWLITRLNLEIDVATGERSLSRSSALGMYYDCITFNFFGYETKWRNLTTCTIGKRLLIFTLLLVGLVVVALALLSSAVFLAYWAVKWGFVPPVSVYMQVAYVLGTIAWLVVLIQGAVSFFTGVVIPAICDWQENRRAHTAASSTRQESIVLGWYRSAKDGICHKVKVVD